MNQDKELIHDEKHSQSKEYRCFCAKNYNSYAGLYLHLKSKHQDAFSLYKNMKISKLLTPLDSEGSKLIFKLKQPSKQQNELNQSSSEKPVNSIPPSFVQQERKPNFKDQPFYLYRPQTPAYAPINYYQSLPPQTYLIQNQSYGPNPVKQFTVSSIPTGYYPNTPCQFYQQPVAIHPPQQQAIFSYPPQNLANPYFVNNGIPYWSNMSYGQPLGFERTMESQQVLKYQESEYMHNSKTIVDKPIKQKSRIDQKKGKNNSQNCHTYSEESTKKSILETQKVNSSERFKNSDTNIPQSFKSEVKTG